MANNFLLESGSTTLLESGSALQLESGTAGGASSFIDSPSRRRVSSKFLHQFRRRPVQVTVPAGAHAHAPSAPSSGRCRRAPIARRGRHTDVVPPQFNPPFVFPVVSQPRRPRGWPAQRGKRAQTIPPQVNPPYPTTAIVQPRRLRGWPPKRGRVFSPHLYTYGLPVHDTFAGSGWLDSADVTGQHYEFPGGKFTKDGSGHVTSADTAGIGVIECYTPDLWLDTTITSFQPSGGPGAAGLIFRWTDGNNHLRALIDANTAYTLYIQEVLTGSVTTLTAVGTFAPGDKLSIFLSGSSISAFQNDVFLTKVTDSNFLTVTKHGIISNDAGARWVLDTFNAYLAPLVFPGQSSRRPINARTFVLARRGKSTNVIAQAAAPVNPSITFQPSQRKFAKAFPRRGRQAQTIPPQFNPPIVFPVAQRRVTRAWLRRRRPIETTPAQVVVVNPPIVFSTVQHRIVRGWLRRGKSAVVVPAQVAVANPTIVLSRTQQRAQRGWLRARGRGAQTVPAQVAVTNPALPGNTTLRRRLLALFLRRRGSGGRVPSSAITFGPTPNNVTGADGRSFVTGATGRSSVAGPDGRSDVTGPSGSTIIQ